MYRDKSNVWEWLIVDEWKRKKEDSRSLRLDDNMNTIFPYSYGDRDILVSDCRMIDNMNGMILMNLVKRLFP